MRTMAIMAIALALAGCAAFAAPDTQTSVGRHQPKPAACTSIGTAMYC
jgi:PBP1b-binding outer membrane lipoprotein LpoB